MKAAFFHDARIFKSTNGEYYSLGFGYKIWNRYLKHFDNLLICTREADKILSKSEYTNYKISSGKNVEFKLNKVYKNPIQLFISRNKIQEPITAVVKEADVCIIRLPSVIGMLAAKECIKQNKPWIAEVVACCWDSLWNYGSIKGKAFAPYMYLMNKFYINKASHAIYVSSEFLQKRYPCKGTAIGISDVELEEINEDILAKRVEKIEERKTEDIVTLGIIGSLNVEYKGHGTAIHAVADLKKKGYRVILKCLGSGDKNKWITLAKKLGVEECIEFCGILPAGKPVLQWLDNIDIFIMPSLQEGLPRSMVEAMSRGCACIGAKTGGIPELIDDKFVVDKKDYKSLSEAIMYLVDDIEKFKEQAKVNFENSKKFNNKILELKREKFFSEFKIFSNNNISSKYLDS